MSLPILRRIDKSDKESIAQAIEDGFDYIEHACMSLFVGYVLNTIFRWISEMPEHDDFR